MRKMRSLSTLFAVVLMLALLASCTKLPEPLPPPTPPAEPLSPAPQIPFDKTDYEKQFADAFAEAKLLGDGDLRYEIADGKATVTGYEGSEKAIAIPDTLEKATVTSIAPEAFANNKTLEVVILPKTLGTLNGSVGLGIFKGCTSLRALKTPLLGERVTKNSHLGYLFGATTYENNSRDVPPSLKLLEIDGSFEEIPAFALFDCNDLVAVKLSEEITSLGKYSFYQCMSLKYLNTAHLKKLGEHAMDSCVAFVSLQFSQSLAEVGLGALENCTDLRSVTLPFVGQTKTENPYLGYIFGATVPDFAKGYYPGRLQEVILLEGCSSLGDYAFFECESLRNISLPNGIASIGVRAFDDCDGLTEVTLPASLALVRENAFMDCDYLESVAFAGENLTEIEVNAFYGCLSLKEVVLPSSLKSLSASCFADCVSLQKVQMNGVTSVGKNAFHNCTALTSVIAPSNVEYEEGNDAAETLNEKKK